MLRNKKKNDINEGKWIAPGGKAEAGESFEQCAVRETAEETGLKVHHLDYRGTVYFIHEGVTDENIRVYTSGDFSGELKDSIEGTLKWIPVSEIMDLNLWEGDKIFLRYLINGIREPFCLTLEYDRDGKLINVIEGETVNE